MLIKTYITNYKASPRNSPWQSAIANGFAEANSDFVVTTLAKILPR